jgi:sulfonate transport system substrate-binding protein
MTPLTRRSVLAGSALSGLIGAGTTASAASEVNFSFQQSSAVLLALKMKATLDQPFAAKGAQPNWHQFSRILDAMTSGAIQFHGDSADAVPLFAQTAGAPLSYYAMESASPHAEALIVPASSPIRTLADLRGKSVAFSKGSGAHFLTLGALRRAGLSIADIRPVYLEAADGGMAYQAGHVDAWAIWDPFLAITQARSPVRVLADGTGITSYNRYYMVETAFAQAHPDLVRIVFDALVAAGRALHTDPAGARRLLVPLWGNVPPDVIDVVVRRRSFGVQPVTAAALAEQQSIADAFHDAGILPRRLDLQAVPVWRPAAA